MLLFVFMLILVPSVGRSSFLPTTPEIEAEVNKVLCQCPQSGNPHFYAYVISEILMVKGCQYPQSGNPHFYDADVLSAICQTGGVNALNRANLISTLPSQNRLF